MKKILTTILPISLLAFAMTGCLKDKGFDKQQYGINDPDTQPPGIGFPLAANAKNLVGLPLSSSSQTNTTALFVNLLSGSPAAADITVNIALKNSLITDYNAANATTIQILGASNYSVPLTGKILKGERSVRIPLTFPNTSILNPNISYGLGFTITSVDGGLKIADNLKDLLLVLNLKNKYDGVYEMNGTLVDNAGTATGLYPIEIWLETVNATDVLFSNREYSFAGGTGFLIHPVNIGGVSGFGAYCPIFTFDLNTNKIVGVTNYWGQPSSNGRRAFMNASGANEWNPSTRDVKLKYEMWQNSYSTTGPRVIFDEVFKFIEDRP